MMINGPGHHHRPSDHSLHCRRVAMASFASSTTSRPAGAGTKISKTRDLEDLMLLEGREGVEPEPEPTAPSYPALSAADMAQGRVEYRRVRCPPHRLTPLRNSWDILMSPVVEFLKLQIRFNPKNRSVELKTCELTEDPGSIQKGADFIEAFMMGFEVQDAVAILRLDDLFIDSFLVTDVKMLHGDHLSRAIGRVAGQDGKTKYAIENATRTRIVMADQKIHIMGSFSNIKLARDAICNLIIGAPPGKVYNQMRNVAKRLNERF